MALNPLMLNVYSSERLKFLTRIRLALSNLADYKFRYNFQDCINLICSCSQTIETSTHLLLYCFNYLYARQTLFGKVNKIDSTILKQNDQVITKFLLFGNEKLLKKNSYWHLQLSLCRQLRDLKSYYLIKSLM